MKGRICIDGSIIPGGYEIVTHGGEPSPEALVSISMRIHNNRAVKQILLHVLEYVESCIGVEPEEKQFFVLTGGKDKGGVSSEET